MKMSSNTPPLASILPPNIVQLRRPASSPKEQLTPNLYERSEAGCGWISEVHHGLERFRGNDSGAGRKDGGDNRGDHPNGRQGKC